MTIEQQLNKSADLIEKSLSRFVSTGSNGTGRLVSAMRYSLLAGGKRVRPFLVCEAAKAVGGNPRKAVPLACAMEMIHTYSLIHDDLPAMDDDDMRRGKKSCHRQFDEATAILAGDALLTQAFEVIAGAGAAHPNRALKVIRLVAQAVGPQGMVGGQSMDMHYQERALGLKTMQHINRLKTAFLIKACVEGGAVWAGASAREARELAAYGESIGFLFQVVDDIIDGEGVCRLVSIEEAYRLAAGLRDAAKRRLRIFGKRAAALSAFADFLYQRTK